MAKKAYQSQASRATRLAQNKNVKHGTVRTGAGGRALRRYDANTGRWNVVNVMDKSRSFTPKNVSPASSAGSARTSSASEGPKRSMPRGSSIAAFANNPIGYLGAKAKAASGPALSPNRPAFGTPMRLSKSKKKDTQGRAVYRWIPKR